MPVVTDREQDHPVRRSFGGRGSGGNTVKDLEENFDGESKHGRETIEQAVDIGKLVLKPLLFRQQAIPCVRAVYDLMRMGVTVPTVWRWQLWKSPAKPISTIAGPCVPHSHIRASLFPKPFPALKPKRCGISKPRCISFPP